MADGDAEHWDSRYASKAAAAAAEMAASGHSPHLVDLAELLPVEGLALDLAGGDGADGCWLAQHGLEVTVADVSRIALDQAISRAATLGVGLDAVVFDADVATIPDRPWQLIHVAHFLHIDLMNAAAASLPAGGTFAAAIGTIWNLQRHDRPGRRFLLEPGEIKAWAEPHFDVLHWSEDWRTNDQHEAWLVARKPG